MKRKNVFARRLVCLLLSIILVLPLSFASEAAVSVPMKKTKVKWDLKPNRTYHVKSQYCKIGKQRFDIRISNFKKKRQGNVLLVNFDILYDAQCFRPSASQVHRMIEGMEDLDIDTVGGYAECYVVDFENGRNLDWEDFGDDDDEWDWDPESDYYDQYGYSDDNPYSFDDWVRDQRKNPEISVTSRRKKKYPNRTYRDSHGCYVWLTKEVYHVTIRAPKDYTNLCIGIGGCSTVLRDMTEEKFRFGSVPFSYLRDYRKAPKNWHFMRVR